MISSTFQFYIGETGRHISSKFGHFEDLCGSQIIRFWKRHSCTFAYIQTGITSSLCLPCSSLSQKPLCPQFPDYVLAWGTVCVKLRESAKEATLYHSNTQKHEESCLTGTLVLQEVITYMSCVEVFAIGIKIESSDQASFGADQRDL